MAAMSKIRRKVLVAGAAALLVAAMMLASCTTPPSGPGTGSVRYVDQVFATTSTSSNVEYAVAPNLASGVPQSLVLDRTEPVGDTLVARPAIVWIHGGGFAGGDKSDLASVAQLWAKRGYVTFSINYRLDPGNRCQDVQDGLISDPAVLAAETARCNAAIVAAQHDSQAAVRWIRANAGALRVDPGRIAVGGTSAGAVTAVNVAQRSEDPGTVGANLTFDSSVGAALVASGCQYFPDDIDGADAPLHLLASELDTRIPFDCVTETEALTRAAGVDVGTVYYFGEGTHALGLYSKYRPAVDALWTAFLVEHLGL